MAERIKSGESLKDIYEKAKELIRDTDTLLKNIQCLFENTGNDIVAVSGISIVCQVNVENEPVNTLIIGRDDCVQQAFKSLSDSIAEGKN